MVRIEKR